MQYGAGHVLLTGSCWIVENKKVFMRPDAPRLNQRCAERWMVVSTGG
jgi:hypothetical protein